MDKFDSKIRQSGEDKRREILKPHLNKRLCFEGVLISIMEPSSRNGYTYGLVFASVYAPNEKIELDHVVIQMTIGDYKKSRLNKYFRYTFTAKVETYYKTGHIQGMIGKQRHYMLVDINTSKLRRLYTSELEQPTVYVENRINNNCRAKNNKIKMTAKKLFDEILEMPNDGSVEHFIDKNIRAEKVKKMAKYEIADALYS